MSVKLEWPSIEDVVGELKSVRRDLRSEEDTDVRLQVYEGGRWAIRNGPSDYDQDHRGYWGASCVFGTDTDEALLSNAEELLDQAKDHAAQNGVEVGHE